MKSLKSNIVRVRDAGGETVSHRESESESESERSRQRE